MVDHKLFYRQSASLTAYNATGTLNVLPLTLIEAIYLHMYVVQLKSLKFSASLKAKCQEKTGDKITLWTFPIMQKSIYFRNNTLQQH